jgi:hypothetical protein
MPPAIEYIDPPQQGSTRYAVFVVPHLHRPGEGKVWLHADEYADDGTELERWRSSYGETVKVAVEVTPGAWIEATQDGAGESRRWLVPEVT